MSESAGRVLLIPKGAYDGSATYSALDVVSYGHNSYVAKQATTGNLPTDTTYWQILTNVTADASPTSGSTNLVESGGVYTSEQNIYAVMGQNGAKNLLPNQALDDTWKGITWKVNSDGTLSASGTATANSIRTIVEAFEIPVGKYILNGCPSGSSLSTYYLNFSVESGTVTPNGGNDIGEGLAFEVTQTAKITVKARVISEQTVDITFKPMIRLASDDDPTYQPYSKTNQQLTKEADGLWDNMMDNGAVNVLNFNPASETKKGYTFTNDNGIVHVTGSRTEGQTGNVDFNKTISLKAGTYKLTGCPSGGSNDTWRLILNINNSAQYVFDYGDGAEFTLDADTNNIIVYCTIMSAYSGSVDMYFKPMLSDPSLNLSYGDYVPYAMTNRELTEELTVTTGQIANLVSFSSLTAYIARKYGKVVELQFTGTLSEAVNTWTNFLTVPDGFRPSHYVQFASFKTYNSCYNLQLSPAGGIQSGISLASGDQVRFTVTYIID